ncbi:MAG: hypothetical protein V1925_04235 [Candidatus Omnitrophota bacterium]
MNNKQIGVVSLIVAILSLLSGWIWYSKNKALVDVSGNKESVGNIVTGNNSPVMVNQQITVKVDTLSPNQTQQLETQLKKLAEYQQPFSDRPKIGVIEPSVTFVNFIDNPPKFMGLVKAGINIPLLNIGGVSAKDVITKWKIYDNKQPITSASEYVGYDPYIINELLPNAARKLYYNPDIGAAGIGTFEVLLEIEYTNAITGERYTEYFRGITDYLTQKDNKPVIRALTRQ